MYTTGRTACCRELCVKPTAPPTPSLKRQTARKSRLTRNTSMRSCSLEYNLSQPYHSTEKPAHRTRERQWRFPWDDKKYVQTKYASRSMKPNPFRALLQSRRPTFVRHYQILEQRRLLVHERLRAGELPHLSFRSDPIRKPYKIHK